MKKVQWVGPMSRIISLFNNFSVNLPPLAPQCETGKNWGGIKMWWNRIKMWGGTVQHRCIKNKSKKIPSIIQTSLTNMQIEFLINGFNIYFLIYSWRKLPTWQFCVINFLDSTLPQGTIFNVSGVYFHACIKYLVRTVAYLHFFEVASQEKFGVSFLLRQWRNVD